MTQFTLPVIQMLTVFTADPFKTFVGSCQNGTGPWKQWNGE